MKSTISETLSSTDIDKVIASSFHAIKLNIKLTCASHTLKERSNSNEAEGKNRALLILPSRFWFFWKLLEGKPIISKTVCQNVLYLNIKGGRCDISSISLFKTQSWRDSCPFYFKGRENYLKLTQNLIGFCCWQKCMTIHCRKLHYCQMTSCTALVATSLLQ